MNYKTNNLVNKKPQQCGVFIFLFLDCILTYKKWITAIIFYSIIDQMHKLHVSL